MVDVISSLLPLFAVFALLFGPLAGWLALRRQRQPVVWLLFGAMLGPIALALLAISPPGRCQVCDEPVTGWPVACDQCGERYALPIDRILPPSVNPLAPASAVAGVRGHGHPRSSDTRAASGRVAVGPGPSSHVTIPARPGGSASGTGRTYGSSRAGSPASNGGSAASHVIDVLEAPAATAIGTPDSWTTRLETLASGPTPGTLRERPITRVGPWPEERAPYRFEPQIFLPAPGPLEPHVEDPTIVAIGVFIGGTERLTIAGRYGIGLQRGRLKILGPFEANPRTVAIDWDLVGLDVASPGGDLILSHTTGRRRRLRSLVFRLLTRFDNDGLQAAILAATRAAESS